MGAPYTSVSVASYNANPPADDGSVVAANRVNWSSVKTKLSDPLNTAIASVNTNIGTAFGKVIGGGGVTSTAISYSITSSDQGKLIRATAGGITLTTPDATTVTSPFVVAILNNSATSLTLDGHSSQTIDGNANISIGGGQGVFLFTDGSNWFTAGYGAILVGSQMGYGQIINGTITESRGSGATTYAVKTLAGNDPSSTDPVIFAFRNATIATGNYVYRILSAALSLTISSGSTIGTSSAAATDNNQRFKIWGVVFDDAGTLRLGVINCKSGVNIYPLGQVPIASSTAEGGAGGADSAHVFYTGTAVTSKSYLVLGYCSYESGLSTAGTWDSAPTRIHLQGPGDKLPGDVIQTLEASTGAVATGATALPADDSIPQVSEGASLQTQAITPTSSANILEIGHDGLYASPAIGTVIAALFQDNVANAIAARGEMLDTINVMYQISVAKSMLAGTASSTTFSVRVGNTAGNTITFNGASSARLLGGAASSCLRVIERMT